MKTKIINNPERGAFVVETEVMLKEITRPEVVEHIIKEVVEATKERVIRDIQYQITQQVLDQLDVRAIANAATIRVINESTKAVTVEVKNDKKT